MMDGSGKLLSVDGDVFILQEGEQIISARIGSTGTYDPNYGSNTYELFISSENGDISKYVFGPDGEIIQVEPKSGQSDQGLISGALTAIDVDGDTDFTFALASASIQGFILNTDGSWTFDPHNENYESLKKERRNLLSSLIP